MGWAKIQPKLVGWLSGMPGRRHLAAPRPKAWLPKHQQTECKVLRRRLRGCQPPPFWPAPSGSWGPRAIEIPELDPTLTKVRPMPITSVAVWLDAWRMTATSGADLQIPRGGVLSLLGVDRRSVARLCGTTNWHSESVLSKRALKLMEVCLVECKKVRFSGRLYP